MRRRSYSTFSGKRENSRRSRFYVSVNNDLDGEQLQPLAGEQSQPLADEQPQPLADEHHQPLADEQPQPLADEQPQPPAGEQPQPPAHRAQSSPLCVMAVGKHRNGKSTALNNIFNLHFPTGCHTTSSTKRLHQEIINSEEKSLKIIDTPGLKAVDIATKKIAAAISLFKREMGRNYILLYCVSLNPAGGGIDEVDEEIIRILHGSLGKEVWDKCVMLFTSCDTLRREEYTEENKYKDHIKENAEKFSELLRKHGSDATVRSMLENEDPKVEHEIVAIPVAKTKTTEQDILPHIVAINNDWTEKILNEIFFKEKEERRKNPFKQCKSGVVMGTTFSSFVLGGAAAGATAGTVAGSLGGPIGIPVGLGSGAGIGAAVGAVVGTVATVTGKTIIDEMRIKAGKELLPERQE